MPEEASRFPVIPNYLDIGNRCGTVGVSRLSNFFWVLPSLVFPEPCNSPQGGTPMIRLAIVDDHSAFRKSLRFILERDPDLSVVAEADDGVAALAMVDEHKPDFVLIDVRLPRMDGLEATRAITSKHPQTRVIVLSLFTDDGTREKAMQAGAYDYCCKDANPEWIVAAIKDGHRQQAWQGTVVLRQSSRTGSVT